MEEGIAGDVIVPCAGRIVPDLPRKKRMASAVQREESLALQTPEDFSEIRSFYSLAVVRKNAEVSNRADEKRGLSANDREFVILEFPHSFKNAFPMLQKCRFFLLNIH